MKYSPDDLRSRGPNTRSRVGRAVQVTDMFSNREGILDGLIYRVLYYFPFRGPLKGTKSPAYAAAQFVVVITSSVVRIYSDVPALAWPGFRWLWLEEIVNQAKAKSQAWLGLALA